MISPINMPESSTVGIVALAGNPMLALTKFTEMSKSCQLQKVNPTTNKMRTIMLDNW